MRLVGFSTRRPPVFIGTLKPVLQDEVAPQGDSRILRGMVRGGIIAWPLPETMPERGYLLHYTDTNNSVGDGLLPQFRVVQSMNPARKWQGVFGGGICGNVTIVRDWTALRVLVDPIAASALSSWRTIFQEARTVHAARSYATTTARELMALNCLGDDRLFELYEMLYQAFAVAARPSLEAEITFRFGYRAGDLLERFRKAAKRT